MDHTIMLGDVAIVFGVAGVIILVAVIFFALVWFFNPFRSGH